MSRSSTKLLIALILSLCCCTASASFITNNFASTGSGTNSISVRFTPTNTPITLSNGTIVYSSVVNATATNGNLTPTWVQVGGYIVTFGPKNDTAYITVPYDSNTYSLWTLATNQTVVTNAGSLPGVSSVVAGSNVTVTANGSVYTVSSTGGGGGSATNAIGNTNGVGYGTYLTNAALSGVTATNITVVSGNLIGGTNYNGANLTGGAVTNAIANVSQLPSGYGISMSNTFATQSALFADLNNQGIAQTNDTVARLASQGTAITNALTAQGTAITNSTFSALLSALNIQGIAQTNDTVSRLASQGTAITNSTQPTNFNLTLLAGGNGLALSNTAGVTRASDFHPVNDGQTSDNAAVYAMIVDSVAHSNRPIVGDTNMSLAVNLLLPSTNNLIFKDIGFVAYSANLPIVQIGNDTDGVSNVIFSHCTFDAKTSSGVNGTAACLFGGGAFECYFKDGCVITNGTNVCVWQGGVNWQIDGSGFLDDYIYEGILTQNGTGSAILELGSTLGPSAEYPNGNGLNRIHLSRNRIRGGGLANGLTNYAIIASNAILVMGDQNSVDGNGVPVFNSLGYPSNGVFKINGSDTFDRDGASSAAIVKIDNTNNTQIPFYLIDVSKDPYNGYLSGLNNYQGVEAQLYLEDSAGVMHSNNNFISGIFAAFNLRVGTGGNNIVIGDLAGAGFGNSSSNNNTLGWLNLQGSGGVNNATNTSSWNNTMGAFILRHDTNAWYNGIVGNFVGEHSTNSSSVYDLGTSNDWFGQLINSTLIGNNIGNATTVQSNNAVILGGSGQTVMSSQPVQLYSTLLTGTTTFTNAGDASWATIGKTITGNNSIFGGNAIVWGASLILSNALRVAAVSTNNSQYVAFTPSTANNAVLISSDPNNPSSIQFADYLSSIQFLTGPGFTNQLNIGIDGQINIRTNVFDGGTNYSTNGYVAILGGFTGLGTSLTNSAGNHYQDGTWATNNYATQSALLADLNNQGIAQTNDTVARLASQGTAITNSTQPTNFTLTQIASQTATAINGGLITNVQGSSIAGILTNNTTGNAATVTSATNIASGIKTTNLTISGGTFTNSSETNTAFIGISTPNTITPFSIFGNQSTYIQALIVNSNSAGSSDWVAQADTGSETSYYADFGINNSAYSGGSGGYALDTYIIAQGSANNAPGAGGSIDFIVNQTNAQFRFVTTGGTTNVFIDSNGVHVASGVYSNSVGQLYPLVQGSGITLTPSGSGASATLTVAATGGGGASVGNNGGFGTNLNFYGGAFTNAGTLTTNLAPVTNTFAAFTNYVSNGVSYSVGSGNTNALGSTGMTNSGSMMLNVGTGQSINMQVGGSSKVTMSSLTFAPAIPIAFSTTTAGVSGAGVISENTNNTGVLTVTNSTVLNGTNVNNCVVSTATSNQFYVTVGTAWTNGTERAGFHIPVSWSTGTGTGATAVCYVTNYTGAVGAAATVTNVATTNPLNVGGLTGLSESGQWTFMGDVYSNSVVNIIASTGTVTALNTTNGYSYLDPR